MMSNSVNTALGFSGSQYQGNMRHKRDRSLAAARILALLTSLLVLAQIIYTLVNKEAFCLDQGCAIVESLSKVPPLMLNLLGFFFFLLVFWGLGRIRRRPYRVPPLISILLLAALAAEAVLLAFQIQIARTFCLYCLCVFGCILLLNLLLGVRQTMQGMVLFFAVFLSFNSLNYGNQSEPDRQLTFVDGAFAVRMGINQDEEHYLFLSSTCAHCKEVINRLETMLSPTVFFNSVDGSKELSLTGIEQRENWSPRVNRELLRLLGINTVPVLISKNRATQEWTISRGDTAILFRLSQQDGMREQQDSAEQNQSVQQSVQSGPSFQDQALRSLGGSGNLGADSCSVDSDCDEEDFVPPAP